MRVLLAVMCASLPAAAKSQASDQQFLDKAYSINQGEIALGRLAEERGTSAQVRDFGKRLENDHQTALDQLRAVAEKERLTMPAKVEREELELYQELGKLSGLSFDQAFTRHMVSGHQHAIELFQEQASHGQNEALRAWAEKQLPVLKVHQDIAKRDLQRM